MADIAGVCDASGTVLGLMPHPENHVVARQHPHHRRGGGGPAHLGLRVFENGVDVRQGGIGACDADATRSNRSPTIELPLPDRRDGKVRASYALDSDRRLMITTDRLSAFDRVIAAVPYKGQVLNELSAWWFERTADVVANHVVDVPDPNVLVARAARPLPVEVVVRGYITGVTDTSLWRQYDDGARTIYGHRFPDGLAKNTALPEPIVTPTTKAEHGGHDEPITCDEVVTRGLLDAELWERVMAAALEVFHRGSVVGREAGLILADTKYEFGLASDDSLLLIDEVHTPDSSRWWIAATYDDRLAAGEEPESLDKEVVRRAYAEIGYRGDGPVPTARRRRVGRHVGALHRRLRAPHRRAVRARLVPGRRAHRRQPERSGDPLTTPVSVRTPSSTRSPSKPREECGVLGISTPHGDGVAELAFFGLFALQHRGQEAAGIAVSDGHRARVHKDAGLVTNVFTRETMAPLTGYHAIGHTRYSTTGSNAQKNIQPFVVETMHGPLALAHNGNVVNATALRDELLAKGFGLTATSDTEVLTLMLAAAGGRTWEERVERTLPAWKGAFSLVVLARDQVIAVRDPWGFRPLSIGRLPLGGHAVASETCALSTLGCVDIDEVRPGEMVTLQGAEVRRHQALAPATTSARCTFEFVYFSRPDSVWDDRGVHHVRQRLGVELATESGVDADVVIPVPDSSIPAAIGTPARAACRSTTG